MLTTNTWTPSINKIIIIIIIIIITTTNVFNVPRNSNYEVWRVGILRENKGGTALLAACWGVWAWGY